MTTTRLVYVSHPLTMGISPRLGPSRLGWLIWLLLPPITLAQVQLETDGVDKDYSSELVRMKPRSPAEALDSFHLQAGFRIELVASEPLIADPVAVAFDEQGSLYVVEMRGYSEQPDEKLGRVRRLTDRNKDGKYDVATDFLVGLSWPTAIACHDQGVLLGHPPDLQFCKDTDGDGKADLTRTWATGFGRQNVQGMMNSFVWGLDGRLYGSTSSNGGVLTGLVVDESSLTLRRRDFAIQFGQQPRLMPVSGGGQHGQSFDRFGNRYVSSNSNHLQWVEWEQRYQSRNPYLTPRSATSSIAADGPAAEVYRRSPVEPWRKVRTRLRVKGMVRGPVEGGGRAAGYFTGATGVTIYRGDAFPEAFLADVHAFVGDVGGNLVHHKVIESRGFDKIARRTDENVEFLASSDTWFRPCQFANGPDGGLYVVDMYRETIEHPLSLPPMIKKHLDLTSGRDRGRIYRVVGEQHRLTARRMPADVAGKELVEMLAHANGWHRETAMRRIITLGPSYQGDAESKTLERLVRAFMQSTTDPQAAVRALYCLDAWGILGPEVRASMVHDSAFVRLHAIRLAEKHTADRDVLSQLHARVADDDIHVRMQVALSAGELPVADRVRVLLPLAIRDSHNAKMRYAMLSSMNEIWEAMARKLLSRSDLLSQPGFAALTEEVLRELGMSQQPLRDVMELLDREANRQRPEWLAHLLHGVGKRGDSLIAELNRRGVHNASRLVEQVLDHAIEAAGNTKQDIAVRMVATKTLAIADFDQNAAVLTELLLPQQPAGVRATAATVAAQYQSLPAGELLLHAVVSLEPAQRHQVLDLACQRSDWAMLLLDTIESGGLRASELAAQHRDRLLGHRITSVAARASRLIGATASRDDVLKRFQHVLSRVGDAQAGAKTFAKLCATCHRLEGSGHPVGPDLQPLRNRGAAFFFTNILDPNREVDARFHAYTVLNHDGLEATGIISNETDGAVKLTAAEGKVFSIRRDEIANMRSSGKSLMPEGFEKDLDEQALADLIAYLIQP